MTIAFTDDIFVDVTTYSWWEWLVMWFEPSVYVEDNKYRYEFKRLNGKWFLISEEPLNSIRP